MHTRIHVRIRRHNFKALQVPKESKKGKRNGQTIVKPANKAPSDSEHIFSQKHKQTYIHTSVCSSVY